MHEMSCLKRFANAGYADQDEVLELGAGAGRQDVTELDAWQKCGALSAIGMSVKEVRLAQYNTPAIANCQWVHDISCMQSAHVQNLQGISCQLFCQLVCENQVRRPICH